MNDRFMRFAVVYICVLVVAAAVLTHSLCQSFQFSKPIRLLLHVLPLTHVICFFWCQQVLLFHYTSSAV